MRISSLTNSLLVGLSFINKNQRISLNWVWKLFKLHMGLSIMDCSQPSNFVNTAMIDVKEYLPCLLPRNCWIDWNNFSVNIELRRHFIWKKVILKLLTSKLDCTIRRNKNNIIILKLVSKQLISRWVRYSPFHFIWAILIRCTVQEIKKRLNEVYYSLFKNIISLSFIKR